jgi:hypothetical protein
MFDLTLAQISHPDRERDLTAQLERRRVLRELLDPQAGEPPRVTVRAAARTVPTRAMPAGR